METNTPAPTNTPSPVAQAPGADAGNAAKTEAQTPAPKTWELKTDGKVRKIDKEDELIRLAQKGLTADSRFEEIANGQKQLKAFHENLKADPKGTIKALAKQIGVDSRQLSEELLEEFINAEFAPPEPELSPEQKRIQELEKALADKQAKEEEEAKTVQEKQFLQEKAEATDQFLDSIETALDAVGFIKDEALRDQAVEDAAAYLLKAYDAGFEPDVADIVDHIKGQHLSRVAALLSVEDDSIFDFLPEEFVKRTGKYWYKKLQGNEPDFSQSKVQTQPRSDRPLKYSEMVRRERQKK